MGRMLDNLRDYSGSGFLFVLLLISIVFLGFRVKRGAVKTMTVYLPIFVLAVFFCPFWGIYMEQENDGEILYRILWMIPAAVIVCFALIEAIHMVPEKFRAVSFVTAVLIVIVSGKYIYASPFFSKAENCYHVPQVVVDICDDIRVEGREVRACFPIEHIQYVRQYTPYVCLSYGRTVLLGNGFNQYSNVEQFLDEETIDTAGLVEELRRVDNHYLILESDRKMTEDLNKYGYIFIKTYDKYSLYLDEQAYLGTEYR